MLYHSPIIGADGKGTAFGNSGTGIVDGPGQAKVDLSISISHYLSQVTVAVLCALATIGMRVDREHDKQSASRRAASSGFNGGQLNPQLAMVSQAVDSRGNTPSPRVPLGRIMLNGRQ